MGNVSAEGMHRGTTGSVTVSLESSKGGGEGEVERIGKFEQCVAKTSWWAGYRVTLRGRLGWVGGGGGEYTAKTCVGIMLEMVSLITSSSSFGSVSLGVRACTLANAANILKRKRCKHDNEERGVR